MRLVRLASMIVGLQLGPASVPALAHPPSIVSEAAEKLVAEEIRAFRKQVVDAIARRDATKLRDMYAPGFMHTHTTGKTDNRDARIVSALAGDPVIETAAAEDLVIRAPNDWVVVATGRCLTGARRVMR
mgnify:CR=1 FL=1